MDLVNVALQVIAIIAIIAVGAFIIVFLSDLLISIIDDHQGIFFRKGAGKKEDYNKYYDNQNSLGHQTQQGTELDFEHDFAVLGAPAPAKTREPRSNSNVDMEAARREQEMLEKANKLFGEDKKEELEQTDEEKAQQERLAKLEDRNKELEEELKAKEKALSEETVEATEDELKDHTTSVFEEDLFAEEKKEEIKKAKKEEPVEEADLEQYEELIKDINKKALASITGDSGEELKVEEKIITEEKVTSKQTMKFAIPDDEEEIEEKQSEKQVKEQIEEAVEEIKEAKTEIKTTSTEFTKEIKEIASEIEEKIDKSQDIEAETEAVKEEFVNATKELAKEIAKLKSELESERKENDKLEEVIKIEKIEIRDTNYVKGLNDDAETFYISRLDVLRDRLKVAKKELRICKREYVPLDKIRRTLGRDQRKLRIKEAQVAKQKVQLFGVNNHDIDPVKQAELEQDIDMLEGLKLSVQHCEDVMRTNVNRLPALEKTNKILTTNVNNLIKDIKRLELKLKDDPNTGGNNGGDNDGDDTGDDD
jgi:hypothetical protein